MALHALLLSLLALTAAEPSELNQARSAAAAGRFEGPDGASAILQKGRQSSTSESLAAYAEALEELLRFDALFRDVYAAGGATEARAVLKQMRELPKLKDRPELLAHVSRLERLLTQVEQLLAEAQRARAADEPARARQLYARIVHHELFNRAAPVPSLLEDARAELQQLERAEQQRLGTGGTAGSPLEAIRGAAALGKLEGADGAVALLAEALAKSAQQQAPGASEALSRYGDALGEVRRHEALILNVYGAAGDIKATEGLLKALKESPRLKDFPELAAYSVRLERSLGVLDGLRADAKTAATRGDFDTVRSLHQALREHPLFPRIPGLGAALDKEAKALEATEEHGSWVGAVLLPVWELLGPPLRLATQVLLVFFLFFPLRRVVRRFQAWRLKDQKHSTLRMVDLSEGATVGESVPHAMRLKAAFQELSLQRSTRHAGAPEADIGEALPQWEAPELRELEEIARLFDDDSLKVGPVSVPLKSLFELLGQTFLPARYAFDGVVEKVGASVRVTLGRKDNGTGVQLGSWSAEGSGEAATNTAFRKLALKVAFHELKPEARPTQSAEAFVAFQEAVLTMQESCADPGQLPAARELLQRALALDPTIPQAKLMLAIVLRKLNEVHTSRALLEELMGDHPRHEELSLKARYNLALLDARSRRFESLLNARRLLQELTKGHTQLALDARACLLDVCVMLVASSSTRDRVNGALREKLEDTIRELEVFFTAGQVEKPAPGKPGIPPEEQANFVRARAYALYALGHWHFHQGAQDKGVRLMQRALVYIPDLLAAHLAIAGAHRKMKRPFWEQDAQLALAQASKLNPTDPLVNMEYAKFLLAKGLPDKQGAAKYYEQAASQRGSARVEWGRLLVELGDPKAGVARMLEGIQMAGKNAPPYFVDALIGCAVKGASALRDEARKQAASAGSPAPALPAVDPAAELIAQVKKAQAWIDDQRRRLEKRGDAAADPQTDKLLKDFADARARSVHELEKLGAWPAA